MKRGIAVLLSLTVLVILLLAGPAEAVKLKLNINQPVANKGKPITFMATAKVESGEILNIDYFALELTGPQNIECRFKVDGEPISGCKGIKIQEISSAPQEGYGYYIKGMFKFQFTLDTSIYPNGEYKTLFLVVVDSKPTKSEEGTFNIRRSNLAGCSLRASDGDVNEGDFAKPSLSFHIPVGEADNGKGTLNGQIGRSRVSYKFDIIDVTENDANSATLKVTGIVETNGSKKEKEDKDATITYHKDSQTIDVVSEDIPLDVENMEITFQKWC